MQKKSTVCQKCSPASRDHSGKYNQTKIVWEKVMTALNFITFMNVMLMSLWIVLWKCHFSAQQHSERQIKYYEILRKEQRTGQKALSSPCINIWGSIAWKLPTVLLMSSLMALFKCMEGCPAQWSLWKGNHLRRNENFLQKCLREVRAHHRQIHGGQVKHGSLSVVPSMRDP